MKVRFGGQDVNGYVLERIEEAEHDGALAPLRKVVSAEPVLSPEVARLARAVADRWAGTLADVLRLAVPARHARVEAEVPVAAVAPVAPSASATAWAPYRGGPAFLQHLTARGAPRAVWTALPGHAGDRWPDAIAQAVAACVLGGRGALVVVPDARDIDRVLGALADVGIPRWVPGSTGGAVRLAADDGPAVRYRSFLAALRGRADVVVGTRASAFAPVRDLGLAVVWDDGDPLHAEPRAPYPHVREVLALRSELESCALLVAGHGRSVEAQALVESGWAREVAADRATTRRRAPRVQALTSVELAREGPAAAARLPAPAWRTVREKLAVGPVLVQVPRAGLPARGRVRTVPRLGALRRVPRPPRADVGDRGAHLRLVRPAGHRLAVHGVRVGRAPVRPRRVGTDRRGARPRVPRRAGARVRCARRRRRARGRQGRAAVVVSTPGAEPVAPGGYAAALLLDASVSTAGAALRTGEDALRRWFTAAALVRSASDGGVVLLVGDAEERATQAFVRWDPAGYASRELAERAELALPPTVRIASVTGPRDAVDTLVARLDVPQLEVLGPVPVDAREESLEPEVRALVRVPRSLGAALARSLAASQAVRSARREGGTVRVQLDPADLG